MNIQNGVYEITKLLNSESEGISEDFYEGLEEIFNQYEEALRNLVNR